MEGGGGGGRRVPGGIASGARSAWLARILLASVWMVMGLGCKVLGLVPRHREIVARILGGSHANGITVAIGWAEVAMALWILSGIRPRLCAWVQIALVAVMNVLEFLLARDLLLFGAANSVVALVFILLLAGWERTMAAALPATAA